MPSQEETPAEACAKIDSAITQPRAFFVRIVGTAEPGKLGIKADLACSKANELHIALETSQGKRTATSLAVSNGKDFVRKDQLSRIERPAENALAKNWTVGLVRGGFLLCLSYGISKGASSDPSLSTPDFSELLQIDDPILGKAEAGLNTVKYTLSIIETVNDARQVSKRYQVTLTFNTRSYLPTKRTVIDQDISAEKYEESYDGWLFGDQVSSKLFVHPK